MIPFATMITASILRFLVASVTIQLITMPPTSQLTAAKVMTPFIITA